MPSPSEERIDEDVRCWLSVLDQLSFYELLGVDEHVSAEDLKLAFHRFAEAFHPDRQRHRNAATRTAVAEIFRQGVEGYRVLSSAGARSSYNLDLARKRARLSGVPERTLSLEDLCATPGGRLHGRQAERALSEGDLERAVELIDQALVAEGPSPSLLARKQAVSDAIELASGAPEAVEVVIPESASLPLGLAELLGQGDPPMLERAEGEPGTGEPNDEDAGQ